jgi:murein DD-endopeptidase MepM/ murein hydrolase activator NlpD
LTVSARRAGKTEAILNSPYSILVLRGTQMRRFVVSPERFRELLLVGLLFLSACGLFFSEYLEAQKKKVDEVIANGHSQIEKLSILRDRAREVQETLSRWKGLRGKIQALLPQRSKGSIGGRSEGEELHEILVALQGELKGMIAALPSGLPVKGRVSSGVGTRPSPWTGEMEYHAGLDFPKPIGTPVHATGDAVVESIDGQRGTLILNHSQQIKTHYAHLSKILVNRGEQVRKGQPIAQVGNKGKSTGPHLHYEVRVAGVAIDPRKNLLSSGQAE